MNVISYKYPDKRSSMPQFLYVDADYDKDLLPLRVREIIAQSEHPNLSDLGAILQLGDAAAKRFKEQHYLDPVFDMIEHS